MNRFKYLIISLTFIVVFLLICLYGTKEPIRNEEYQVAYEVWSDSGREKELPYISVNGVNYLRFQSLAFDYIDKKTDKPLYSVVQNFGNKLYETKKTVYGYENDIERLFLYYDMEDPDISPVCLYYRSDVNNLEPNETNINEVRIIGLENCHSNYSIVDKRVIELFLLVHNSNSTLLKKRQLYKQIIIDENILKNSTYQSKFQIVTRFKDYPYLQFTLDYIDFSEN